MQIQLFLQRQNQISNYMKIGILKEPAFENRVALLPEAVKTLAGMKQEILVEKQAGVGSRISDRNYENVGATVLTRGEVLDQADMLLMIHPLQTDEIKKIPAGKILMGVFSPYTDHDLVRAMVTGKMTSFSLDTIPRITRAQSMDILSSMATVAGYKAVLEAANHLPYFFPMLMTAAGTIKPARVLILGAGVAGLQAIATARKLGAIVEAFDVRSAVKEEVQSLGGKFIEVEGAREDAAAGGYAVEQTEDFRKRQMQLIHDHAIRSEVVICTAQIPGKQAPVLIKKETVEAMQPVSVIIDLASSSGGNCELTKDNETVVYNQVKIIGKSNYPSEMPTDASKMYGNNVLNFLKLLIDKEGNYSLNLEDEVVKGTLVTHQGEIINERVKEQIK